MPRVPSPVVVRPATDADLPTAVRLRAQANPDIIVSLDGMRLWLSDAPENALLRMFLAERDGVAAGWAVAMRAWHQSDPTIGMVDVLVDEEHRRQGVGSALATQALQHVDAHGLTTVHGSAVDDPAPAAFLAGLGFVERSAASTSAVDPRTIEPLPVPEGVTLVPFGELDDPAPMWLLDLECSHDIPGDEDFDGITLEQWARRFWHTVLADDEASLAAYVDGDLAGLTMLRVDRPTRRAQNNLTGVRATYRGRGLARLLKTHSLARAAAMGVTSAITDNDERNAPMLAVNRALGYRHLTRRVEWERRTAAA